MVWAKSAEASCTTGLPTSDYTTLSTTVDATSTLGAIVSGSSSTQLAVSGDGTNIRFNWTTDKTWAGSCRQLMVLLNDGTLHTAVYQF